MAGQGSNDRIAELLKEACPPESASPGFKARLRQQLIEQSAAAGTAKSRPFWQQPLAWIPAAAAAAAAMVLIIYFAAFHSTGLEIVTSEATGIQTTTATLNGNLDNLPATEDVQVSFEWGVDTGYGRETAPRLVSNGASVQEEVSGLEPKTTYHYRLKVVHEQDTRYGPDRVFTTGPAPPAVITRGAAEVGTTSATLAGKLESLGSADRVGVSFQWGPTTAYGNQTRAREKTSTGRFTIEISGLDPGVTYHFRASANGDGDPVFGADMTFTTGTAPPSVETLEADGTGAGSVRLNGRLTAAGTAESVAVWFAWGATRGGPYTGTAGDQELTREGAFSADLSGLQPGATYYYQAIADGDGDPVYGAEESFVAPTEPPAVATGRSADVHAESATLHGVLGSPGTAGTADVYFEWGTTTDYGSQTEPEPLTSPGDFSATLADLMPDTSYHFRAVADGDGDPVYGPDVMFTTSSALPGQASWYLGQEMADNASLMYQDDESQPQGTLTLYSSGQPASRVWRSDQAAGAGTFYPAGDWSFRLLLSQLDTTENVTVEIGVSDNAGVFLPRGSLTLAGQGDNGTFYAYEDNITVDAFTVPSDGSLAARITTTSVHRVYLRVGGSRSFVRSPAYPEPAAPKVTTTPATDVGQTTATLRANLDSTGTGDNVTVYFEWGATTEYGSRLDAVLGDAAGGFSAGISGLSPGTAYHFRAVAAGDGALYGADLVFTTLP